MLTITVQQGGPEFIPCYCTSRENYQYSVLDGVKVWSVGLGDGKLRGFKAAGKTMRLDIHKTLPADNAELIRYIIESARPVEPGAE